MAQIPKFIDVTRTFLPIDPNAFPESLHTSGREESPEDKIPAMAYKGYNFLPTPYGYKSYFGINKELGVDAINSRIDAVFVYQNAVYENILIVLAEDGIWTKKGNAAGAWTHDITIAADINPNVHYNWTYVVIGEILYAYMQGKAEYYTFVSSATIGVVVTAVVPNFLNMVAQVGIFRAAGRLAFWDTDNSIGYSNIDDFADFTPSIETLAGNVKFSDVQGRIVTILPHGPGFIIYSTKSIIYVAEDLANTFQWNPATILSSTGIAYPRNVTAASPDTTHFAYTVAGLKRITKAQEETIVPEVTDYLKDTTAPVYLKILQDRFLFLELLDSTYITGKIQRSDVVVPPVDYVFPGAQYTLDSYVVPDEPNAVCPALDGLNTGSGMTPPATPPDAALIPNMRPKWICYLARNSVPDPADINWVALPCPTVGPDGIEANMNPNGKTTAMLTTDSTNKVAVTGEDAYVDGIWTMERFVQTQTAIWEMEDAARTAYLAAIQNRARAVTFESYHPAQGTDEPVTRNECELGQYPVEFTKPVFGYNTCSFWLTRFCIEALDLVRVKANNAYWADGRVGTVPFLGWSLDGANPVFSSLEALAAYRQTLTANVTVTVEPTPFENYSPQYQSGLRAWAANRFLKVTPNAAPLDWYNSYTYETYGDIPNFIPVMTWTIGNVTGYAEHIDGRWKKTSNMWAYNKGIPAEIAPIPESAYCELAGWTYDKNDDTEGFIAAGTCMPTTNPPRTSTPANGFSPGMGAQGEICGKPFEGASVDAVVVEWPAETVSFPAGSFLLQNGSVAPVYPVLEGALVYDLQLKKWGKMKQRYMHLLDYSPINSTASGSVEYGIFGMSGGILTPTGKFRLFDSSPTYSYISYGKIGYYRDGNTSPTEVRVDFKELCTGYVKVETSLDGHLLASELTKTQTYTEASSVTLYGAYPGRWANIEIGGIFDINYLEYRGFKQGRR